MSQSPEKGILVVRQESLGKDLMSLEMFLESTPSEAKDDVLWQPADSYHFVRGGAPSELNKAATQNICCALQDEMKVYRDLIERAANLLETHETLAKIHDICQFSTFQEFESTCKGWNPPSHLFTGG